MKFIRCTFNDHANAILEILNEAIINSTALYEYEPRTSESMVEWFETKEMNNFPVIGAVDDSGNLLGFASYGTFRAKPAYKYSVEHSIYVHQNYRGKGLGRELLQELIAVATEQQYHVMVGGIDVTNIGSVILHEKLGFSHAGTIEHAAFKFGRWLNLGFYQLLLTTPKQPRDG